MRSALLPLLCEFAAGFYLPGVAPIDYADGARVDLKVPRLAPSLSSVTASAPTMRARPCLAAGEQADVHQDPAAV